MWPFRKKLTEATQSILWLWKNDREGWKRDDYQAAHKETGVGVWLANEAYGLHLRYEILPQDAAQPHILRGKRLDIPGQDRKALFEAFKTSLLLEGDKIHQAIEGWAKRNNPPPEAKQTKLWRPTLD